MSGDQTNSLPELPRTLFLELTSHCNMHCDFCPSDILRRPHSRLTDERLRSFLDQIHASYPRIPVLLNVLGEPLLDKRVYSLLDEFEREGRPVTLITNMTLLEDSQARRELLRHANLTLAMSLQTATAESFTMRGYERMPFAKFFGLIFVVIEDKFRLGSSSRLEIHVASNHVLAHDASIQADGGLALWPNFRDEKEQRRWIAGMLRRLERLAAAMEKAYPEAFTAERSAAALKYREHLGTKIALNRAGLPRDFQHLKDDVFWGYMALPNVFLVFKSLELWTRAPAFLRAVLPAGRFFYVEERTEPRPCMMADSFGLLANGDYVFCCLDYEGEMALGNIDTTPVAAVMQSTKRAAVRSNAMTEALCRRCRGNLFVFKTSPLTDASSQAVDKFGQGWWPWEAGLDGVGGRWTNGKAWAYVFVRIPARHIRFSFRSPFDPGAPLRLLIFAYDQATAGFAAAAASLPVSGLKGIRTDFEVSCDFSPGRLYRLEIDSPVFIPDDDLHNGDTRHLGLAVYAISLTT